MDPESLKDKETIKAAVLVVVTNAIASAVTTMRESLTAASASANIRVPDKRTPLTPKYLRSF